MKIIADHELLTPTTATLQHLHDKRSDGKGEEGVKDGSEAAVAAAAVQSAAGEGGAPSLAGLSAQGRTAEVQRPRVRAVGARAVRVRLGVVKQPERKPTPVSLPVPAVVVCQ